MILSHLRSIVAKFKLESVRLDFQFSGCTCMLTCTPEYSVRTSRKISHFVHMAWYLLVTTNEIRTSNSNSESFWKGGHGDSPELQKTYGMFGGIPTF